MQSFTNSFPGSIPCYLRRQREITRICSEQVIFLPLEEPGSPTPMLENPYSGEQGILEFEQRISGCFQAMGDFLGICSVTSRVVTPPTTGVAQTFRGDRCVFWSQRSQEQSCLTAGLNRLGGCGSRGFGGMSVVLTTPQPRAGRRVHYLKKRLPPLSTLRRAAP